MISVKFSVTQTTSHGCHGSCHGMSWTLWRHFISVLPHQTVSFWEARRVPHLGFPCGTVLHRTRAPRAPCITLLGRHFRHSKSESVAISEGVVSIVCSRWPWISWICDFIATQRVLRFSLEGVCMFELRREWGIDQDLDLLWSCFGALLYAVHFGVPADQAQSPPPMRNTWHALHNDALAIKDCSSWSKKRTCNAHRKLSATVNIMHQCWTDFNQSRPFSTRAIHLSTI